MYLLVVVPFLCMLLPFHAPRQHLIFVLTVNAFMVGLDSYYLDKMGNCCRNSFYQQLWGTGFKVWFPVCEHDLLKGEREIMCAFLGYEDRS